VRALERVVPVRVLGECLPEHRIGFLGHVREQGAAVGDAAACPWRFGRRREGAQLVQPSLRFRAAGTRGRLDPVERRELRDHRVRDRLQLRERRLGPAGAELEHAKRPPRRVVDQAHRMRGRDRACPLDEVTAALLLAAPGGDQSAPDQRVRLQLGLPGVPREPLCLFGRRVRGRPPPYQHFRERDPGSGDRQAADGSDRARARHDAVVEAVRGGVIADVEAGAARREHEVDIVGFVLGGGERLADRRDPRPHVAGELLGEADEQADEELVVFVAPDVE
jgi:hypothetical protein